VASCYRKRVREASNAKANTEHKSRPRRSLPINARVTDLGHDRLARSDEEKKGRRPTFAVESVIRNRGRADGVVSAFYLRLRGEEKWTALVSFVMPSDGPEMTERKMAPTVVIIPAGKSVIVTSHWITKNPEKVNECEFKAKIVTTDGKFKDSQSFFVRYPFHDKG